MQNDAVGHDTELSAPKVSTSCGLDQAKPAYVHSSPETPTTTQEEPLAHEMELRWLDMGALPLVLPAVLLLVLALELPFEMGLFPASACAAVDHARVKAPENIAAHRSRFADVRAPGDLRPTVPPRFHI